MMYGWIIFIILIVVLLAFFNRDRFVGPGRRTTSDQVNTNRSPMETLKERFARGEMDKEEFEKRKEELGN